MKAFKDLSLATKFSLITAFSLSTVFAVLIIVIYYNQKNKIINDADARFFSHLSDLVNIIDQQRKSQENKVRQALFVAEKMIQEQGGIREGDSLINFFYIDPATEKKQNIKVKELYLGERLLHLDSLLADDFQAITGTILAIEQFIPTVGYTSIVSSKIPAFNNIRTIGSVTLQKPIVEALNNDASYLGTSIGTISKKIITVACKPLKTNKASKLALYAYDVLQDDEGIKKNIIQKNYLEKGFAYLINENGVILFHPSPKAIGMDLKQMSKNMYDFMAANMTGQHKYIYTDQNDITKYKYFQFYPSFNMFVAIVIPEADLLDKPLSALRNLLIAGAIVSILICNFAIVLLSNSVSTKPTKKILTKLSALAEGKSIATEEVTQQDEYGQIFIAMNSLIERLNKASHFAKEVGKGNFNTTLEVSANDELGKALIEMRNDLKEASEQEAKRRWINEGISKFNEIIRLNANHIHELTFQVLSELIKYVNANQGAVFLVEADESKEPCLELSACYAYKRRKYAKQRIYRGEGLVGQTWQEGEEIYLKKIPENYIRIGSGLGDALPTCLFIAPLKFNEEIQGILEIASFTQFSDSQREFILKIVESLAAAVSVAKFNENTKKLLQESQYMMENLRSQEEEMRQNYEELQATQEEMFRREMESKQEKEQLLAKIKNLEEKIKA